MFPQGRTLLVNLAGCRDVWRDGQADLNRVMEREGARDRESRRLPSHNEAVTAFLEKRDPVFNQ